MPLNSENLKGMWAGLPVPWDHRDRIDEESLRENVRRICRAGAPGVYTHGTTGEFYAQTEKEWKLVVNATVEESKKLGTPVQIGCTALWTAEVIRRVEYAQRTGADGVQIAFPFWLELTDDQAVRFLQDVANAVPGMPIILYNTERTKKPLTVNLLKRIMNTEVPVIGCKGARGPEDLQSLYQTAPKLKFFVGEYDLATWWNLGARGCYSSFVYACPKFMLRYYGLCEQGSAEAQSICTRLKELITEFVLPRWQRGLYDTAFDRTFAAMTGFLTGSLLLSRAPYDSPTQREVDECRDWCARHLPEFIQEI